MTKLADSVDIVIGVDTHKHTHTASFVAPGGGVEEVMTANTTKAGYMQLLTAARCWPRRAWAIEGTATYGAGLVRVLLAAGVSRRMGRNKLLIELDGESVVRRAAVRALAAGLDPLVVVLGHEAERIGRELEGLACRTVVNADHALGQAGSLRAGFAVLPATAAAAVALLADMPLVTAAMVAALVTRWRAGSAPVIASDYQGVTAPPILYDRSVFPEIALIAADGSAKEIVHRHRDAESIAWPKDALADLDVPADVARAGGVA